MFDKIALRLVGLALILVVSSAQANNITFNPYEKTPGNVYQIFW